MLYALSPPLYAFDLYVCCCSFFPSLPCATLPTPSYRHEFIRTKTCGDEPSPSVEQNLIGSLVGKPARLTTGYTISLSKHVLQLIYIALSYNLSTDPRPTPIAHRGRGRRPACSPAAHSARQRLTCYILIFPHCVSLRRNTLKSLKSYNHYVYYLDQHTKPAMPTDGPDNF